MCLAEPLHCSPETHSIASQLHLNTKLNVKKNLKKKTVFVLVFCLVGLSTDVSGVLKSSPIIALLSISPFMSINICSVYLGALTIGVHKCFIPFLY